MASSKKTSGTKAKPTPVRSTKKSITKKAGGALTNKAGDKRIGTKNRKYQ